MMATLAQCSGRRRGRLAPAATIFMLFMLATNSFAVLYLCFPSSENLSEILLKEQELQNELKTRQASRDVLNETTDNEICDIDMQLRHKNPEEVEKS